VTVVEDVTANVPIVNVALVAPAGTRIQSGTETDLLSRARFTLTPALGAGPVKVTVPTDVFPIPAPPPTSEVGLTDRPATESVGAFGVTVRNACSVEKFRVPLIVTTVEAVTGEVAIGNVARVAPSGTVTLAGTLASACVLFSGTEVPPAGAGGSMTTVPVEEPPPATPAGSS
jgi:hypothetical protein